MRKILIACFAVAGFAGCADDSAADLAAATEQLKAVMAAKDTTEQKYTKCCTESTRTIANLNTELLDCKSQLAESGREVHRQHLEIDGLEDRLDTLNHSTPRDSTAEKNDRPEQHKHSNKEIAAASNFEFGGVSFKTTLAACKQAHPSALSTPTNRAGRTTFILDTDMPSRLEVAFIDDSMHSINLHYTGKNIQDLGGQQSLLDHLSATFGAPDKAIDGDLVWKFPSVNRRIALHPDSDGGALVAVIDLLRDDEYFNRKKKLDAGS